MGISLQQRLKQLKEVQAYLPQMMSQAQKDATIRAVEAATDATPPEEEEEDKIRGTNTVTGELKEHWATDSKTEPVKKADGYETTLANNKEYASYVNDGHRMDRHFVPGLYINPENGLLEYDGGKKVGIMVGTKTKYVKGKFMTDKGKEAYEETVGKDLDKKIQEVFK